MGLGVDVRRVKGVNLIGLVKLLRGLRKRRAIRALSATAEALLADQILISDWYPFTTYLEILDAVYREILGRSEEKAREMGTIGGRMALSGFHRHFIKPGDPMESLLAMRHTWRVYYDFGELRSERDGPNSVRFVVDGYPDMPAVHGQMIAGWHVAAALEGGATDASTMVLEGPWRGANRFIHLTTFR